MSSGPASSRIARSSLLWPAAGAFLVSAVLAVAARGLAGDEEAGHYLIARYAPAKPTLFLSLVGRPLVTLALTLPAQVGFLAARLASALATAVAAYAVGRLALRTRWVHPAWAVIFFLMQPFMLAHAGTAMTEPWAAALVALALLAYVEKKPLMLALVTVALPLARFEAVFFWPFIGWALFRMKRPLYLALLPLPFILWNFGGTLASGDPLWLLHQTEMTVYPRRALWHYAQSFAWIVGAGLLVPLVAALAHLVPERLRSEPATRKGAAAELAEFRHRVLTAAAITVAGCLLIYTALAWWKPITNGNLRYFAYAAPALALLAAAGVSLLAGRRSRWGWAALGLAVVMSLGLWGHPLIQDSTLLIRWDFFFVVAAILWLGFYLLPDRPRQWGPVLAAALGLAGVVRNHAGTMHWKPYPEHGGVARAAGLLAPGTAGRVPIHSAHPLLAFYAGGSPYNPAQYPPLTEQIATSAPVGAIVFWETHYTTSRAPTLTLRNFLDNPDWTFLGGSMASDSTWVGGFFLRTPGDSAAAAAARSRGQSVVRGGLARNAWVPIAFLSQSGVPKGLVAVREDPSDPSRWLDLATLYVGAGRADMAQGALARAERLDPRNPRNDGVRANILRLMRRYREALDAVRRGLARDPANGEMNLLAARILLQDNRVDEAGPYLMKAADALPNRWDIQYTAGRYLFDRQEWSQAEHRFAEVVRLNPKHLEAAVLVSQARAAQGKLAEAEAGLKDLIRRRPAAPEGYLALGDLLAAVGRGEEARQVWKTGLEKVPGDATLAARVQGMGGPGQAPPGSGVGPTALPPGGAGAGPTEASGRTTPGAPARVDSTAR